MVKKMKITFIQDIMFDYFGPMMISAVLKKAGHQVEMVIPQNKHYLDEVKGSDIVAMSCMSGGHKWYLDRAREIKENLGIPIILGGPHPTFFPEVIKDPAIDYVCIGEGEEAILELVNAISQGKDTQHIPNINTKTNTNQVRPTSDLDLLPSPDRELFYGKYSFLKNLPTKKFITGRGCPYQCLAGNTVINTVEGDIPIKELLGKKEIGVYTYDPVTKDVFISKGININKTGNNKTLVRVRFDDGSFIDCTPDHKFLTFKNGNQFVSSTEKEKEAINLVIGESVRAVKFYKTKSGYIDVNWGRRKHKQRNRMVMEYLKGRPLESTEQVHHSDENKSNDSPNNLVYCKSQKEHFSKHPEFSSRMKEKNPVVFLTDEKREEGYKKTRGLKRSLESRIKYRNSKMAENNPNWKGGEASKKQKKPSRLEINHKVVSVKFIENGDTYNLEVPSTHWFFANNVLVHNCTFCYNHKIQEMYHSKGKFVRRISVNKIIEEIKDVRSKYPLKTVRFADDTFAMNKVWFKEFCDRYKKEIKLPFTFLARANEINEDLVKSAKEAGCESIYFGIEAGTERVRNTVFNKRVTNEDILRSGRLLHQYKIKFGTYNMLGNPTETLEEAYETVNLNIKIKADIPMCTITQPYPRTKLYDSCVDMGILDDHFNPDDLKTVYDESPLKYEHKREMENLHKWFFVAVKFPWMFPLIKKLIKLPPNPFYKLIFMSSFAYRSYVSFNMDLLHFIRLGLKMRKVVYK